MHAMWDEEQSTCVLYKWDSTILAIFYLYSASSVRSARTTFPDAHTSPLNSTCLARVHAAFLYDVAILLLTLYAVRRVHREQMHKRWGVGDILCIQGIGYVVVTCLVNVPVAVLGFLDLNGMSIHSVPFLSWR